MVSRVIVVGDVEEVGFTLGIERKFGKPEGIFVLVIILFGSSGKLLV